MKISKSYLNSVIKEELIKVLKESEETSPEQSLGVRKAIDELQRGKELLKQVIPQLIELKKKNEEEGYFENIPQRHKYEDHLIIEKYRAVGVLVGSSIGVVFGEKVYDNTWLGKIYLTPEEKEKLLFPVAKDLKEMFGPETAKQLMKYKSDNNYEFMRKTLDQGILKLAGYNDTEIALFKDWQSEPGLRSSRETAASLIKKMRKSKSGVINIGDRD